MTNQINSLRNLTRYSPLLQVLLVGFLILLLQIPISMIEGIIRERETRRDQAMEEVTDKWGKEQTIIGPMVTVPYIRRWVDLDKHDKRIIRKELRHVNFLPEILGIDGIVENKVRYRGIFKIPVYSATLNIKGRFARPDLSDWCDTPEDILWQRAQLSMQITDVRAIKDRVTLQWNKKNILFLPGSGEFGGTDPGIHVPLEVNMAGEYFDFSLSLNLNGSGGLYFAPFGRETTVNLEANWPDPSFQGNWLPTRRTITDDGFKATWEIPYLGRNYPQRWESTSSYREQIIGSRFGTNFISPVDNYRMSQRSVKYEILFLLLTFLSIWLFEIISKLRVHSLQYLLVGAAMCLFYLLHLSLSEHLGFLSAYLIASSAIVILITAYSMVILKTGRRAATIGAILTALYTYLYILLQEEDYALLIGSVGLFIVLGILMYITRKIDWFNVHKVIVDSRHED